MIGFQSLSSPWEKDSLLASWVSRLSRQLLIQTSAAFFGTVALEMMWGGYWLSLELMETSSKGCNKPRLAACDRGSTGLAKTFIKFGLSPNPKPTVFSQVIIRINLAAVLAKF